MNGTDAMFESSCFLPVVLTNVNSSKTRHPPGHVEYVVFDVAHLVGGCISIMMPATVHEEDNHVN